jgi:hypothetical protein
MDQKMHTHWKIGKISVEEVGKSKEEGRGSTTDGKLESGQT